MMYYLQAMDPLLKMREIISQRCLLTEVNCFFGEKLGCKFILQDLCTFSQRKFLPYLRIQHMYREVTVFQKLKILANQK